ncbi:MAG: ParB/RepB/Spo0J family partition protein [Pseudomonadota bacterium]
MLATKRYDYIQFDKIQVHPFISNHRIVSPTKVDHYAVDILRNGLLEPLVVWERNSGEYYLVGGFHRLGAIRLIREKHPGYFDRVDVRVVSGELDEIRALNLKLNSDRVDTKITDYFETVVYLNNANWDKEKIASFLGKSITMIEDIIRFTPGMDRRLRKMLENGDISWSKAKGICRQILESPPEQESIVADRLIGELLQGEEREKPKRRLVSAKRLIHRLTKRADINPDRCYTINTEDILALLMLLSGKGTEDSHLDRVRNSFPGLID